MESVPSDPCFKSAHTLRPRHVSMIKAGGIIGVGLFVGSSASIAVAGPVAIVSYVIGGITMLLIIRSIAEMATFDTRAGPFTELVRKGLGNGAGFVSGWLYWYFWELVVPIETLAAAHILHSVVPLPVWQIGVALLTVMTAINLVSLRSYGESEFWLSSIKVASILAFVVIAIVYLSGLAWAGDSLPWSNPDIVGEASSVGMGTVLAGLPSAIFAFTGAEIVTLAAADSSNPARAIEGMTRSLALRIVLFYVVPLSLVVVIVPWREIVPGTSPFASALQAMHIPGGAPIMNVLVLITALSCLNAAIYVTSSVLRTLADKGDAPRWLAGSGSSARTRSRTILLSSLLGYVAVFASIHSTEKVFAFLVNMSGAVMMFVYLLVSAAHLRARSCHSGNRAKIERIPWSSYVVVVLMVMSLAGMAMSPILASQLYLSLLAIMFFVCVLVVRRLRDLRMGGRPQGCTLSGGATG